MHHRDAGPLSAAAKASHLAGTSARRWTTDPYAPAPRSVAIAIRTAHLLAMAGYLGQRLAGSTTRQARWRNATTATGALLLATEATHSRRWAVEGRGLLVLAHAGVLLLGHRSPRLATPVAVAALVIGAVGSHLPKSMRKWSLLDGPWRDADAGARRLSAGPGDDMHPRRLERGEDLRPLGEAELLR